MLMRSPCCLRAADEASDDLAVGERREDVRRSPDLVEGLLRHPDESPQVTYARRLVAKFHVAPTFRLALTSAESYLIVERRQPNGPLGAYGFEIEGLREPERHLAPVEPSSPVLRIVHES